MNSQISVGIVLLSIMLGIVPCYVATGSAAQSRGDRKIQSRDAERQTDRKKKIQDTIQNAKAKRDALRASRGQDMAALAASVKEIRTHLESAHKSLTSKDRIQNLETVQEELEKMKEKLSGMSDSRVPDISECVEGMQHAIQSVKASDLEHPSTYQTLELKLNDLAGTIPVIPREGGFGGMASNTTTHSSTTSSEPTTVPANDPSGKDKK